MSACASFNSISKMLEECAPGSTVRMATHSRVIHFKNKVYRGFPKYSSAKAGQGVTGVSYAPITEDSRKPEQRPSASGWGTPSQKLCRTASSNSRVVMYIVPSFDSRQFL